MPFQLSPREQVFATPELLEAILARLSQCELLFAQRISHQFQDIITTSPTLQQLLFFRPVPSTTPRKQQSSLLDHTPLLRSSKDLSANDWSLNPLLRRHFVPWFFTPGERWDMPNYESIEMLVGFQQKPQREAFMRKEASWRKMLLLQPCPTSLFIVKGGNSMGGYWAADAIVPFAESDAGGVTMGVLYDITESFLRHNLVSSFGLEVANADSVPIVTLNLSYTKQCCDTNVDTKWDLRSLGAEMSEEEMELQYR